MSNGNGQHAPEIDLKAGLYAYVLPSSGLTVYIKKVAQARFTDHHNAIRMKRKPPPVPVQTVNIGGEEVTSENPADPEYINLLTNYEREMQTQESDWFLHAALDLTANKGTIDAYRKKCLEEDGTDYADKDDWYILIEHILSQDVGDISEVYAIALSMSRPTGEAIAAAKSSFQR